MAGLLYFSFTDPFTLGDFCGKSRPTWVFPVLDTPDYTAMRGEVFILVFGLAALVYLAALRIAGSKIKVQRSRFITPALLIAFPLIFIAVLLPAYPMLSSDIFKYVFDGRILTEYGQNPFTHVPAEFPEDRFFDLVYWKAEVNAHGPIWRFAEATASAVGNDGCDNSILAMKVWPALAYLATTLTIFLGVHRANPAMALPAALTFAWNPLVLLESMQNGHNDVVAALPLLLAVLLAVRKRYARAFPFLAIAVLIKPLAALAGPFILIAAIKDGPSAIRKAAIGIGIGIIMVVAAFSPFWEGAATLQGYAREELFTDSPAAALLAGLQAIGVPLGQAMRASSLTAQAAFLAGITLVAVAQSRSRLKLSSAVFAALLLYVLVGSQWFNPWYLVWLVPFAAIQEHTEPRILGISFSLLAPLVYAFDPSTYLAAGLIFIPMFVLTCIGRAWIGWPGSAPPALARAKSANGSADGGRRPR